MHSLSQRIKARAAEIGLSKIGIARSEPLADEGVRLNEWLGRGFQGEMGWMEREPEKRSDPQQLLPGARSVIVAAINYYTKHEHEENSKKGKLSRYAWGDDYHDIVREKLTLLLDWIKTECPNAVGKVCVDTAPMMDKAWAVRGGLGWIGKHTNVITTDMGSWVFIGEIVLDIELDYDWARVDDHCGTCTACLDACPTGAIVEPYVVDARKCLSYATIELRSETLPEDITAGMEGWLYGCDICQDVCPWNRFETPTAETRFEPRGGETSIDLDTVLKLTPDSYATRFRRTAIKRAKLASLKRNAKALKGF